MEDGKRQPETRWDALKEIVGNFERREAVGYAWPLYLHILFHGDREKHLVASYPQLEKDLNVPMSTIRRWKEKLVSERVATSSQGRYQWSLKLLPPYDAPLTCLKSDHSEILIRSDTATQKLLKQIFRSDSVSLLPLIAELVHKVDRLEQDQK